MNSCLEVDSKQLTTEILNKIWFLFIALGIMKIVGIRVHIHWQLVMHNIVCFDSRILSLLMLTLFMHVLFLYLSLT